MKSAVILAILGAAAALPAPQAPPPAVVPTTAIPTDTPMTNPMASGITMGGAKPTGVSSMDPEDDPEDETSMAGSKPTGAFSKGGPDDEPMTPSGISPGGAHPTGGFPGGPKPPKGEKTWEGNHKTFDNGQWSQWATKTGGWHPDGERPGPGPTGWGKGKGKGKHHSGWATKTGGHHPNHPKQTPPMDGMGPTGPKSPMGSKPTMMPEDDERMSILPAEPTEPAMVRRALDINYHLAPRHDDDHDDSPKGPGGPKQGDDDDEKEREKHEKDGERHHTFNENPGFGTPTPTFAGARPHGTGMPGGSDAEPTISLPGHRKGRPTDGAFGGKPSDTVPEPSDVASAVPPMGTGTAGKPQTRPSNPEEETDNTEDVEPTPTMKL